MDKRQIKRAHKKLEVWKESVALATDIYKITETFPKSELYAIASQMRRASISVSSNIAEGAARHSPKEFSQFLNIAGGSISELDTQLEIALNLGYVSEPQKQELDVKLDSISSKLAGLIKSVRSKTKSD